MSGPDHSKLDISGGSLPPSPPITEAAQTQNNSRGQNYLRELAWKVSIMLSQLPSPEASCYIPYARGTKAAPITAGRRWTNLDKQTSLQQAAYVGLVGFFWYVCLFCLLVIFILFCFFVSLLFWLFLSFVFLLFSSPFFLSISNC
jgi:hypothetical protein